MTVLENKMAPIGNRFSQVALLWAVAIVLTACAQKPLHHAPIIEHGTEMKKAAPPAPKPAVVQSKKPAETLNYVVQKGDTMYSIAFMHGVDYRELAELNHIENASAIKIGQQLRIPVAVETKEAESKAPVVYPVTSAGGIKKQPKVGKIPYSEKALAQAEAMQEEQAEVIPAVPEGATVSATKGTKEADDEEAIEWGMPTIGRLLSGYSENAKRKGIDLGGKRGQAIVASAAGKVVYSGSGLRGYGKLIIIKHNKTYLSAYAHNDQILVKEGQNVTKGQQIAEMGETDSDTVKLHFEIRKFGRPVDPAEYLPMIKP